MSNRSERMQASVIRGAEARQILEHPLFDALFSDMQEETLKAILKCGVTEHEERLALCTVLRVLRGMPDALKRVSENGEFDAKQLAQMMKVQDA